MLKIFKELLDAILFKRSLLGVSVDSVRLKKGQGINARYWRNLSSYNTTTNII